MAANDCFSNLQTVIASWKRSRNADCNMKLVPEPAGHIILGMEGLVWSIDALALQNPSEYSFTIMDVKRPNSPSFEAAEPDLSAKFELLHAGSMESVRRADEALDKLHEFSRLFSLAGEDKRWWIVVDAKIMARACESAKEAVQQGAQAVAALFPHPVPIDFPDSVPDSVPCFRAHFAPIPPRPSPVSVDSPVPKKSGWWIDRWTAADELWATSFVPRDSWKYMVRGFQREAVEDGSVLHWCSVREFDAQIPVFEFDIAIPEFLDGDDALLRIGLANDRALTVLVSLEKPVEVICSQEGLEPATSVGLRYLLPERIREYINCALEGLDDPSSLNVVEGLLRDLIRYLAFLGNFCVICGCDRLLDVPQSSTCSHICRARKQRLEDVIARVSPDSDKGRRRRRERFVKNLFQNSTEGCRRLGNLLCSSVVDDATAKFGMITDDGAISYADAIGKVAEMDSISVALAMEIPISNLWINDTESFKSSQASCK